MGGGVEKGGYVATCAEISVEPNSGEVRVVRVVTAFECGAIVNPDGLRNQVIGANIMGLGGALFESIEFADGKISNPHFAQYRVPRFRDIPQIVASVMQIAFFMTPIIWKPELLGHTAARLLPLNPFFAFLEIVRAPLLGTVPDARETKVEFNEPPPDIGIPKND